tara:strand:- start:37490 stop:37918 length:429 start_codon:yes stop_codon:yes gene_type:complete
LKRPDLKRPDFPADPSLDQVVGIGTDLLRAGRIADVLSRHGERFVRRILTEQEAVIYRQRGDGLNFLAKQYAAKEALAKALGTGIAKGVGFRQLEILRDSNGAPYVFLHGAAADLLRNLGGSKAFISLSDDDDFIQAFAVLI